MSASDAAALELPFTAAVPFVVADAAPAASCIAIDENVTAPVRVLRSVTFTATTASAASAEGK